MAQSIVLVITVTQICGLMGADSPVKTNDTLDDLCEHPHEVNKTVLLTDPLYILDRVNACLIVDISELTIQGDSGSDSPTVIRCIPSDENFTASGFVFINCDRLTIANVVFQNCGALLDEETRQLGNSSLFQFDEGEASVLVCRNCSDLTLKNVKVIDYIGRAFIGIDIYGNSTIENVTIANNIAELPGDQCKGSGLVWMYTNNTWSSNDTTVNVVDSVFSNNTGCRVIPNIKDFVCGDLLANSFYSITVTSDVFQPVGIPSAGAMSFILQQHSLVQASITNSHFENNKGLCYGAILAIYISESAYNAMAFSKCTFSDNAQTLSNFTYLSGRYFGSTITLLMKHFSDHSIGKDCFQMTDSVFANSVETCNSSQIVMTQFPSSSGTCVANLRNVSGNNIRLLYAVSLETGASSFLINLSDIHLIGNREGNKPKLKVGDGLLTFSYVTRVVIHGSDTTGSLFSQVSGPVISAEVTNVILTGKVTFVGASGSSWTSGAAMYFRSESKIWFQEPLNLIFSNNTALEGGAIYSVSRFAEYCAFQYITHEDKVYNSSNIGDIAINVTFISNRARTSGNSIFAYPLVRCSNRLSPTIEVDPETVYDTTFHFKGSVDNNLFNMSSKPLWVCLCGDDPKNTTKAALKCDNLKIRNTFPGKTFSLSIVALDESYLRGSAIIYNNLEPTEQDFYSSDYLWHLGYGEDIIRIDGLGCSEIQVTIHSNKTEIKGQMSLSTSETINYLKIPFTLHNCPLGFELRRESCDCVKLFKDNNITCSITDGTVTRPGTSWIGTITDHDSVSDRNSTTLLAGYSEHCPTRYCDQIVTCVNVSDPSSLCLHNRTGVLCGQCSEGLSITVGSPVCQRCSNWWLFMIPVYALLGLAVVALLIILKLTVAQGTINGLIFYANLLNINTYTLIAGYKGSRWAIVFISFLNLELGFPVCLYNGLNEINKALLSIVFPTYILLLAVVFVYVSRFSRRFSQSTSRCAIPVLSTLIYISYFKLLRFSVNGFAVGIVYAQSSVTQRLFVWYYDGSVRYLQDSRHVLLFIMVLAVVFVFIIPFGVILTGIRFFSRFRIVNKFKPLIDAYCAPYKDRYRFWFGSRLWVLLVLYILFSILRNNPLAFLFSQAIVLIIFTLAQVAIMPFRSKVINSLDHFFMLNALFLTITVLYMYQFSDKVSIISAISVSLTLLVFCCIIGYHAWDPLKSVVVHWRNSKKYARLETSGSKENVVTESSVTLSPSMEAGVQKHYDQPATIHHSEYRDSILEDSVANRDDTSD